MLDIYKASAGAGKTFRLTRRYITLLLGEPDDSGTLHLAPPSSRRRHRRILAITFTNKATDEMKRRIVHELAVLAGMEPGWTEPSPYLADLVAELHASPGAIAARAGAALRDLLNDFGFFNVSTIDSFFQSVLRTFAREAELPGNYEVDLDEEAAVRLGVQQMLTSLNREAATPDEAREARRLEHRLGQLMEDRILDGKSFNIFNRKASVHDELVKFVGRLSDETFAEHRDEIEDYLADPSRLERLTAAITRRLTLLRDRAAEACHAVLPLAAGLSRFARDTVEKWSADPAACCARDLGATPRNMADNPAKGFLKAYGPSDAQLALLAEAGRAIVDCHSATGYLTDVRRRLYVLALLGTINSHVARFRAESSTLLLSDTNSLLRRIIGPDNAPFIYERTGMWFHHFLIDEFQDTSRLQWLNLTPLIEESLGYDRENLVIGDEKQCIYRFRNSDPSLLHNLHREFGARSRSTGDTIAGNTNWRSASTVVRFNNTLFSALAANAPGGSDLAAIYAGVAQQVAPPNAATTGYVLFEPYTPAGSPLKGNERKLNAFENTARHIARQLAAGYRPADIAVLFRTGIEATEFIEFILKKCADDPTYPRLKVMSDESLRVSRSRAVRLVISVLRVIASADFAPARGSLSTRDSARLVHRYEWRLSCGDSPHEALSRALSDDPACRPPRGPEEIADTGSMAITSIIERVIASCLTDAQRRDDNIYLTALLDRAVEMTARGVSDPQSFLNWWDTGGRNLTVAAAPDPAAIRVMTIHKSKGLEFACVHLPYTDHKPRGGKVVWMKPLGLEFADEADRPPLIPVTLRKQLADTPQAPVWQRHLEEEEIDSANVVYVAFTRAINELTVGYEPSPRGPSFPFSAMISAALDKASDPAFVASLRQSLPEGVGDAFISLPATDGGGRLELGAPTVPPPGKKRHTTLLDPTATIGLPADAPVFNPGLWQAMRLDEDTEAKLPTSGGTDMRRRTVNRAMRLIATPADIPAAVAALIEGSLLPPAEGDALTRLLEERVAGPATAQWFTGYRRLIAGRTLALGRGRSAVADRLVWLPDGGVDVVMYDRGEESDAAAAAGYIARRMTYAGHRRVRAWVWDTLSGRVTPVSR